MNPDTERILEYLDNDDYDGARNYAERHACESDVCAEYRDKNSDEVDEFYRSGCERSEHESGNPDCW